MRLLLIAYEFPPSPSPQSLRWSYLARELVGLGHEVHVLTIDLGGSSVGLPQLPTEVRVHRTYAGPARGVLALLRRRKSRSASAQHRSDQAPPSRPASHHVPTWRKKAWDRLQEVAALVIFPDLRGEWYPWALRRMNRLLRETRPDVVISSHEPATTLQLGLLCKSLGMPWVADLADPVLAPYTPRQWRSRSRRLEDAVCKAADHILVTNEGAARLLFERHGRRDNVSVLSQGFDGRRVAGLTASSVVFDPDRLELLYTGSFYSFRRADALLKALAAVPGVRLNIAAVTLPDEILEAARLFPDQIRLLGFMPHLEVLDLQWRADVLVNIANDEASQIPGKLYEYLGARTPIVHLSDHPGDFICRLLQKSGRGSSCRNDAAAIRGRLDELLQAKRRGLMPPCNVDTDVVLACSWENLAKQLDVVLHQVKNTVVMD